MLSIAIGCAQQNVGNADTLGRLQGSDRPGLVSKLVGEGCCVYRAAPMPPPVLLRNICAQAGVAGTGPW